MSETETKGLFTEEIGEPLRQNRFIVGITIANIPEYVISDVIPTDDNTLRIGVRIHSNNIPAIIELQKELEKEGSIDTGLIKISFLDARGNVVLNDWYDKCMLRNIVTGPLDYNSDGLVSFYLVFKYLEGHHYELPI